MSNRKIFQPQKIAPPRKSLTRNRKDLSPSVDLVEEKYGIINRAQHYKLQEKLKGNADHITKKADYSCFEIFNIH